MISKFSTLLLGLMLLESANSAEWGWLEKEFLSKYQVTMNTDVPGFVVAISTSEKVELLFESGAADIEQNRKIDIDTVFHIASLSKQITAAALAHSIVSGKVSLEDPVYKWIPATKKYGDKLKIKHLVYMTSGLTEYTNVVRRDQKPWATFHYFSVSDAIQASLSVDDLLFEPGSKWQYSNINYMLITEVVSKAYGKPFSEVVREKVFAPLNMTSSLVNDDVTQIIPNRANAYLKRTLPVLSELNNGAQIQAKENDDLIMIRRNSPHYGGSGVMTSMSDWQKWQRELMTKKVFGESFWGVMLATVKFDHDKTNDALGLVHGVYNAEPTVWYEGGDIDASSYSVTLLESKINISCFSNDPLDSCGEKVQTFMRAFNQRKQAEKLDQI